MAGRPSDEREPAPYGRDRAGLAAFAALVALVVFYAATIPLAGDRDGDFVHLWSGGRVLVLGGDLYSPVDQKAVLVDAFGGALPDQIWQERQDRLGTFFYPPPAALLYGPLALLPMRVAAQVMAGLTLLATLAAAWLVSRMKGLRFALGGALLLSSASFFVTFVLGQNGVLTVLVVVAACLALTRDRDLLAGLLLGLLVAKPNWLFALGWIPLVLGRWRAVAGMAISALALAGLGQAVTGAWGDYLALAPRIARLHEQPGYPLDLQHSALGITRRWAAPEVAGWALALGVTAVAAWRMRALPTVRALALGIAAACWLNPHVHHYELGLVAVALLLALSEWKTLARPWRLSLLALLVFHHTAFALMEVLGTSAWLPLPAFATLAAIAWLALAPSREIVAR